MSNQTTATPDSETLTFPPGFRWGVATASYQYEGDCENSQWRAWEKAGSIANGDRPIFAREGDRITAAGCVCFHPQGNAPAASLVDHQRCCPILIASGQVFYAEYCPRRFEFFG